mmetsp:Transcript_52751/g.133970  ORF Transcript_52751/g.133970 Transcript_52751/m.133970 type:complete len:126 (-) Transcript_52751:1081-1458(-)
MMIDFRRVSKAVSKKQLAELGKPTAPALLPKLDSLQVLLPPLLMLPALLPPLLLRDPWLREEGLLWKPGGSGKFAGPSKKLVRGGGAPGGPGAGGPDAAGPGKLLWSGPAKGAAAGGGEVAIASV